VVWLGSTQALSLDVIGPVMYLQGEQRRMARRVRCPHPVSPGVIPLGAHNNAANGQLDLVATL